MGFERPMNIKEESIQSHNLCLCQFTAYLPNSISESKHPKEFIPCLLYNDYLFSGNQIFAFLCIIETILLGIYQI